MSFSRKSKDFQFLEKPLVILPFSLLILIAFSWFCMNIVVLTKNAAKID